jgi:predicted methyltransferase
MDIRAASIVLVSILAMACEGRGAPGSTPPATGSALAPPPAGSAPAPPAPASSSTAATAVTPPATREALRAAAGDPRRSDAERARDRWLHPDETLAFFGLRDDMAVIELSPDKGQWTAVLAPVLHDRGHLRIATGDRISEWAKSADILAARMSKDPGAFDRVEVTKTNWMKCGGTLGPDGSADMVLTFRNMHDWLGSEVADKILAAAHAVLKPGGTFGLTDHRGKPGAPTDARSLSDEGGAYVPQDFMIETVEKAGFKLVASSEVNANPKDTKDWPKGALTLPPQLALGDKDRTKYAAIGETDCMTLRFARL